MGVFSTIYAAVRYDGLLPLGRDWVEIEGKMYVYFKTLCIVDSAFNLWRFPEPPESVEYRELQELATRLDRKINCIRATCCVVKMSSPSNPITVHWNVH